MEDIFFSSLLRATKAGGRHRGAVEGKIDKDPAIAAKPWLTPGAVKLLEFSVFARKKCFAPMLFGKMKEVFWCFRDQVLKHLHNQ